MHSMYILVVTHLILVSTNICLQQSSHWCKCSEVCFLETQVPTLGKGRIIYK